MKTASFKGSDAQEGKKSFDQSSGLDRIDSNVRKQAEAELEEFQKQAEAEEMKEEKSSSFDWKLVLGWVIFFLYVLGSSMTGPLMKKTMDGTGKKKFYPYNLTSVFLCTNVAVGVAAFFMNNRESPFKNLSRATLLKFLCIRVFHCVVLIAGPIVLLNLSMASDFVFGNTNLFMTAAIRYFVLKTPVSRSQILILSEILILALAYVATSKISKDLSEWNTKREKPESTGLFTEDVFSVCLLLINKFIQSCIRVVLEKIMKSELGQKSIFAKLSLASCFDVPIYVVFMMCPIPKTGASVWEVGPFGKWHYLCAVVILCQCTALAGIYYILSNMDAMYLTFGSFCASLLGIVFSYPAFLNVDPFELSLFVIIIGMVGLVVAYEFETATGKYINGLLKRTHLDRVQLALVKLARSGATPARRKRISTIFEASQEDYGSLNSEEPTAIASDGYKDAIWIRERVMV
jgi:drug/metabolite transporter (DMT)-like permease